jgi:PAS domain S-box-containing protein
MTKPPDHPEQTPGLRWRAEAMAERKPAPEELERLSERDLQATLHELRVHQIELEMQNEELLRVQEKLEEARARYYDLYDLAPVGYLILSPDGLILEANQAAVNQLGAARATLVKQPITRFILNLDQDVYYLYRKQLLQTGEPHGCDLRLLKPDGTMFWAHLAAGAGLSPDTPVNRVVLVDITDRKRIEAALARSEAMLRATQEAARIGSWEWDVRTQAMSWTRELYRLYQFSPGGPMPGPEALARSLACYRPEDQSALQTAFTRCLEQAEPYDLRCLISTVKGRPLWVLVHGEAILENGKVARVTGFIMDIIDRRVRRPSPPSGSPPTA